MKPRYGYHFLKSIHYPTLTQCAEACVRSGVLSNSASRQWTWPAIRGGGQIQSNTL